MISVFVRRCLSLGERHSMKNYRLVWLLACSLVHLGCARNAPPGMPAPAESFSFTAQALPDSILDGSVEGTATVDGKWITVVVTGARLTVPPGSRDRWRSLTLRSFLAVDYRPGPWKMLAQSAPINVWPYLEFPRESAGSGKTPIVINKSMTFLVAIPPGASITTSRLAFEIEWVTLFKGWGETESNFAFSQPIVTKPGIP
jgi:hypothetical protein